MFPFTKKKTPETQPPCDVDHDSVRKQLSETNTKLEEVVRKMQDRLAQRALQLVPSKVK